LAAVATTAATNCKSYDVFSPCVFVFIVCFVLKKDGMRRH